MKKEDWKYLLQIKFREESERPEGIRMYFHTLADAARKMASIGPGPFAGPVRQEPFDIQKISTARIIYSKDHSKELEVTFKDYEKDDQINPPGLYYHFPNGIIDFEKKSGIDLSGFQGYGKDNLNLLVSYRVQTGFCKFKNTIGYDALCKDAEAYFNQEKIYNLSLSSKWFGDGRFRSREVSLVPFIEEFYYNNPNDALRDLLLADYNGLDETVAWENDLKGCYSHANVQSNGSIIAALLSVRNHPVTIAFEQLRMPGIHLHITGDPERYGIKLPSGLANNYTRSKDYSLVGTYNALLSKAEILPKLKIQLLPNEKKHSTIKRATTTPGMKRAAPIKAGKRTVRR